MRASLLRARGWSTDCSTPSVAPKDLRDNAFSPSTPARDFAVPSRLPTRKNASRIEPPQLIPKWTHRHTDASPVRDVTAVTRDQEEIGLSFNLLDPAPL
jgi:hypothetical protein